MNKDTLAIVRCWENAVWEGRNKYVRIDNEVLLRVAGAHADSDFVLPAWDMYGLYPRSDWTFAVNQIVSNVFNFCFNIFDIPDAKYKVSNSANPSNPWCGSYAMQRKIYEHFGERLIHAHDLEPHVKSLATVQRFFADITPIPFPELRFISGDGLAQSLEFYYDGNPMNLLESAIQREDNTYFFRAFNNGGGLVDQLIQRFPAAYGSDIRLFDGEVLYFNKRAQLVALILHGRASGPNSVLPAFADIYEIGPIADYEVPRGLRAAGILYYSPELAERVDHWKPLEKGSAMEVEIRMATVVSCMRILEQINKKRAIHLARIHMGHLDYWLWQMGKKSPGRPHLVRTDAY